MDEALVGVDLLRRSGAADAIAGLQYDSRRVQAGDLFVAMRGGATDGNRYIDRALAAGASAIVTDSAADFDRLAQGAVAVALVEHGRRALATIAANLFGHPERHLHLSAITGTNGKTTTAFLTEQLLRAAGRTCVLVGTIETRIGREVRVSEHTTPESRDLLALFADGVKVGASEVVMEMSSHALAQERVWGVPVDIAVFTNLTQDHLDYHGTMEAYLAAKARLFAGVGQAPPRIAVLNVDDAAGRRLQMQLDGPRAMTYGVERGEYRAEQVVLQAGATSFRWCTPHGSVQVESPLTGMVNVYNLLAASCAGLARGLALDAIAASAVSLDQVPGRFEVVPGSQAAGFTVVVDYAHTDDALRNLIALARALVAPAGGRVLTLFGCGGDRDRTKRPRMGQAAGEGSDLVILTSDNPRTEDPCAILDQALDGLRETSARYLVEPDRALAIRLAIAAAQPGDLVLIAGKGHEKVQVFADRTVAFDDVQHAAAALAARMGDTKR